MADDAASASGISSLIVFGNTDANTADATFDNYAASAATAPEPSVLAVASLLAFPALLRGRRRAGARASGFPR